MLGDWDCVLIMIVDMCPYYKSIMELGDICGKWAPSIEYIQMAATVHRRCTVRLVVQFESKVRMRAANDHYSRSGTRADSLEVCLVEMTQIDVVSLPLVVCVY